jgi:hypothetical protein
MALRSVFVEKRERERERERMYGFSIDDRFEIFRFVETNQEMIIEPLPSCLRIEMRSCESSSNDDGK